MKLHNLLPPYGKKHKVKRVGRGDSSGKGNYSGRGLTGEGSRSGRVHYLGFEGGQMPLYRRLPKRGFSPLTKELYQEVNLYSLNVLKGEKEITPEILYKKGLIKKIDKKVKILGKGEIETALVVKAHKFSLKARDEILKKGGKVIEINTHLLKSTDTESEHKNKKVSIKETSPVKEQKIDEKAEERVKVAKKRKNPKAAREKKSVKTKAKVKTKGKKEDK